MKKIVAALLCFASLAAGAQKIDASKVPAAVKAAFSTNFPAVKDAKWGKEKDGGYEASFKQGGQDVSATFEASGAWKETEKTIAVASLPAAITKYLQQHYKGQKIKEAAELKMADGTTRYEAQVKGTDVIFDNNGNLLKTQKN